MRLLIPESITLAETKNNAKAEVRANRRFSDIIIVVAAAVYIVPGYAGSNGKLAPSEGAAREPRRSAKNGERGANREI